MKYTQNIISIFILTVLVALGSLVLSTDQARAGLPACVVDITKDADPEDDTPFDFTAPGSDNPAFTLIDPSDNSTFILVFFNNPVPVTEIVPPGWALEDVVCGEPFGNITVGPFQNNGRTFECGINEVTAFVNCTFRNVKQCSVTIEKMAVQGDDTPFDFTAPGSSDPNFTLQNNEDVELNIDFGDNVEVTELVPDGWILEAIECSLPDGVVITEIPNGRNFACSIPDGNADCVFINTPIRPIPTLSEWGLIAMAAVIGIIGLLALRRRRLTE